MKKDRKVFIKEIRKEYSGLYRELQRIINSYDLIPNAPSDEFDSLNNKILSNLYKSADFEKVKSILDSELCITYGLYITEFDSDKIAYEIIQWWKDCNNSSL